MKCVKCGHGMIVGPATLTAEIRGEQVEVSIIAPRCENCGRMLLGGRKGRRLYHRTVSDAYRAKHDLLTSLEIDQLRRRINMTWTQFANYVEIGVATLKRWMGGEIQTQSLDSLVRLKADHKYAERALADLLARLATNANGTVTVKVPAVRRSKVVARQIRIRAASIESVATASNTQLAQAA